MDVQKRVQYWIDTAEHDLPVAENLVENGHYSWALFIGHLVLEKILKAHYVRDNAEEAPKIHDLVRLAERTKLKLTQEIEEFLFVANTFNIEARYPQDKLKFYKICTKKFTQENFQKIEEVYQWLKSQIQ